MGASSPDAVVVGAGPNGLAAAVALARAGREVLVVERRDRVGGGAHTAELTLPGFRHDVCAAIHPLAVASPFLRTLPLREHGLEFAQPEIPLAHPFDDGTAAALERSVAATAEGLGPDRDAYRRLFEPLVTDAERLLPDLLTGLRPPRHPVALARFGIDALRSTSGFARTAFAGAPARALFAGSAAHSTMPLERKPTASFGLVLTLLGHVVGWPVALGGSQAIGDALARLLRSLGGRIETGREVRSLDELPRARAVLLDLTPRQVLALAGDRLPAGYRSALARYRYGPGAFKLDWALSDPIPWRAEACRRTATLHLGGTLEEIEASERAVWRGRHPERPFVLLAQQSLVDATRAPAGRHTAWAYCHVPNASTVDMTERIEAQVERFAPGFRETILARSVRPPAAIEADNPNVVGGDVNGGVQDLRQLFTRPVARLVPHATPVPGLLLCSASTPPGGGVHGMSGFLAAQVALRRDL